ncbi:MAG: hypothetical protein KatS3mg111_2283 [Pirellulaceae bacterium]|nr:MAG: hypothetical protein KatS3mg111_2283 [Pirellulaceae bacterium]
MNADVPHDSQRPSQDDEQWLLSQIKQQPSRLRAKRMGRVINRLMAQRGYGQIEAAGELEHAWRELVGDLLADATRVGRIYRGNLIVEVSDPSARQQLHFEQSRILKQLRARFPQLKIRGLSIRS